MSSDAQKNNPLFTAQASDVTSMKELVREGVALFNDGKFFECHEVLEQAWLKAQGASLRA